MSATGRKSKRRPFDHYDTPAWCVRRLLEAVPLPGGRWLEPSAGDGAIIRAVNAVRHDVRWTAVEEDAPPTHADVAILNPPFSSSFQFLERCLQMAPWVCMLEKQAFQASKGRNEFMRRLPPDVYPLPNRPDFTGGGGDMRDCSWYVWTPNRNREKGETLTLALTPLAERKADKNEAQRRLAL